MAFTYVTKSADQAKTNTTTPAADADLVMSSLASGIWVFEGFLFVTTAAASLNFTVGLGSDVADAGVQNMIKIRGDNTATAFAAADLMSNYITTPVVTKTLPTQTSASNIGVRLNGMLNLSTTTTVSLYWSPGVSSASAVTLKQGSWIRYNKIG